MIRCFVDEEQENWDLHLNKLAFAYNTSRHSITQQTPFEMMFGRKPRIPIDIILPNLDELNREPNLKEYKLINEFGTVKVMEDCEKIIEENTPLVAQNYLNELKRKLSSCYQVAIKNRNCRMDKTKIEHDRKIRRNTYKFGDYVLTDHPKLKKGLSHGFALKYYGPYVVVGVNENGCDYLIRLASSPRAKVKQIHKNRLKAYFYSGITLPTIKEELKSDEETHQKNKRHYKSHYKSPERFMFS